MAITTTVIKPLFIPASTALAVFTTKIFRLTLYNALANAGLGWCQTTVLTVNWQESLNNLRHIY
jgi:hypothetical protein